MSNQFLKRLFDRSTLTTIINSLVFSKLFYCSSMWASTTKKNIARFQKTQNFTAQIVTGAGKYDHITPILKKLHWLPVAKQLEVRDTLMAFKCITGLAALSLCNKFTTRSQVHTKNTRNNNKLLYTLYHFLDQQQVSDLSHIGLLSSEMTFQKLV